MGGNITFVYNSLRHTADPPFPAHVAPGVAAVGGLGEVGGGKPGGGAAIWQVAPLPIGSPWVSGARALATGRAGGAGNRDR